MPLLEILPVGPGGLFQICDGQKYGHLEIEDFNGRWERGRDAISRRGEVVAFIASWLDGEGVPLGCPHPPRLKWSEICREVPAAQALLH